MASATSKVEVLIAACAEPNYQLTIFSYRNNYQFVRGNSGILFLNFLNYCSCDPHLYDGVVEILAYRESPTGIAPASTIS